MALNGAEMQNIRVADKILIRFESFIVNPHSIEKNYSRYRDLPDK